MARLLLYFLPMTETSAIPAHPPFLTGRRIIPKPKWLAAAEDRVGRAFTLSPNTLSLLKLLLAVPLVATLPTTNSTAGSMGLFLASVALFFLLDYLDGLVARQQDRCTSFGRIFDRLTDYPILFILAGACLNVMPLALVAVKLYLDLTLLGLFLAGRGPVENRVRTTLSYGLLFVLLAGAMGWIPALLASRAATLVLGVNITLGVVIIGVRTGLLAPRRVADLLSAGNLAAGLAAAAFALQGRVELCLPLLLLGAALDGLDGAAARRWGGSRVGVYADDVADAVSYGLAPGVALAITLGGGWAGWTVGAAFTLFTWARLVYFTLNKASADPERFSGLPSTAGAVIALCAILCAGDHPGLVGLLVGAAAALMVAFDARYRHPGRWLASHPRLLLLAAPLLALGATAWLLLGPRWVAAPLLMGALVYGLFPAGQSMARAMSGSARHT